MRRTLIDFGAETIERDVGFEQFNSVAGGETAGIPFAAWMADRLMLPMQYVRKKPKDFGRNAQIEGHIEAGDRVLLVEDMTTDGRSKVNFCTALREAMRWHAAACGTIRSARWNLPMCRARARNTVSCAPLPCMWPDRGGMDGFFAARLVRAPP